MELLKRRRSLLASIALVSCACVPELDSDESTVSALRVLAVVADPPEATARQEVRYRALVADASGARTDGALTWFHCLAEKPLAELGPIGARCLDVASGRLPPIGAGSEVKAALPNEACSLFGPNPPQPMEGQPPGRPVDADESGGYRLPVILGASAGGSPQQVVLYEQRIACGLPGVSPAISLEFQLRYHANENPAVQELRALRASGEQQVVAESTPLEVTAGERIELEVVWPSCPRVDRCGDDVCGPDETRVTCADDCAEARGCGGQERYLLFDRERAELTVRTETLRVAWYATGGHYDEERTGAAEAALLSSSKNAWTAPLERGLVTLWVVLRDARGGVGYRQASIAVR